MPQTKKEIIDILKVLFVTYPDLRAGQIIGNAIQHDTGNLIDMANIYYLEDKDFSVILANYIKNIYNVGKNI